MAHRNRGWLAHISLQYIWDWSGLGLSIARSIILAHGGELTLSNRKPVGLRAEIRLPPAA
ncbi:MAG: hypothetical protein KDK07_14410 [Bauldia sp.]|nr:hypothetical protein [Bauldia sp.]